MTATPERSRLLLVREERAAAALAPLRAALGANWELTEATSFERARFLLQMDRYDVLLLDAEFGGGDVGLLSRLAAGQRAPAVLLADDRPAVTLELLRHRVSHWLPRALALGHPPLLEATLRQAVELGELRHSLRTAMEEVRHAQRQVNRLVEMLWETMPVQGRGPWFSQRHMLERLEEEVARAQRHGGPLALVLGEVEAGREPPTEGAPRLAGWVTEQVLRGKRRCDVAGQYGPGGFMVLLPRVTDRGAVGFCRRLQRVLERLSPPDAPAVVSFGIASYSPATPSARALLRLAEERLELAHRRVGEHMAF